MKVKLENWSLAYSEGINAYTAPELIVQKLTGNVYGHPRFTDGKEVTTSYIQEGDLSEGGWALTGSGTHYLLGNMDSKYKEWLNGIAKTARS